MLHTRREVRRFGLCGGKVDERPLGLFDPLLQAVDEHRDDPVALAELVRRWAPALREVAEWLDDPARLASVDRMEAVFSPPASPAGLNRLRGFAPRA